MSQLSFVTKPKMGLKIPRDPYPFPKLEGDVQFRGEVPKKKRPTSTTSEAQAKASVPICVGVSSTFLVTVYCL